MPDICRVAQYGNLSYLEAKRLPCDEFALMRKHAFIHELQQTEEGQQYLADCERLKQTRPDLAKLRKMNGYKAEESA